MIRKLKRLAKRALGRVPAIEYREVPSFAEAKALAVKLSGHRHDAGTYAPLLKPSLIDMPDCFAAYFALLALVVSKRPTQPIRVLDFGGGFGSYKQYAEEYLGISLQFDWTVVETPELVAVGRENKVAIKMATSLDDAGGPFDLVIVSGALQQIEDWAGILSHPAIAGTEFVFIARTPLGDPRFYCQIAHYQSGDVSFPGQIISRESLFSVMSKTHNLFASFALEHHLGELGLSPAPSMIWRLTEPA